jgi:hypothetical protein
LTRKISDHTPLLLDTGNGTHENKQSGFKLELSWLLRDDFLVGCWCMEKGVEGKQRYTDGKTKFKGLDNS